MPPQHLLVMFTKNAATEMKDRIVDHCEDGMRDLVCGTEFNGTAEGVATSKSKKNTGFSVC